MAWMCPTNSKDSLTPSIAAGRTPTAGFGGGASACSSQAASASKPMQAAPKKAARKPSPVLSHLGEGPGSLWSAAGSTAVWAIGRVPGVELVMVIFLLDCPRVVGFRPPRSGLLEPDAFEFREGRGNQ